MNKQKKIPWSELTIHEDMERKSHYACHKSESISGFLWTTFAIDRGIGRFFL